LFLYLSFANDDVMCILYLWFFICMRIYVSHSYFNESYHKIWKSSWSSFVFTFELHIWTYSNWFL